MSQLSIMSPQGNYLNICESLWYVRNDANDGWIRVNPVDDLRVRHGSGEYWLPITCDIDQAYCPPEGGIDCWPGRNGDFESSEFRTGGPTGYLVCDCNGLDCYTYTGHTPDYNVVGGRFITTSPTGQVANSLPGTIYGSGESEITEVLFLAGEHSGAFDVSVMDLDGDARVRIYHGCQLLADTYSEQMPGNNRNEFSFFYNAESDSGNQFITVRVDVGNRNSRWRVKIGGINQQTLTNFDRPGPCFGTFGSRLPCFVNDKNLMVEGVAAYEMVHQMPEDGPVHIDMRVTGSEPVTMKVFYAGQLLAEGTSRNNDGKLWDALSLVFNFAAVGGEDQILVRYESTRLNNSWEYSIYCPSQPGSVINPMPCMPVPNDILCRALSNTLNPAYAVTGMGAIVNDVYYDMTGKNAGDVVFEFYASNAIQIGFFQGNFPNEVTLSGLSDFTAGHHRMYFNFNPALGSMLHMRVIGNCCPNWDITVSCPVPPAILSINDASVVRGRHGEIRTLCFDVGLSNKYPHAISFDFQTSPITAIEAEGNCIVPGIPEPSPYCNIVSEGGVQTGSYKNSGIPKVPGVPQAIPVSSVTHSLNCAPGGHYYVLELEFDLAESATYTFYGTADDNLSARMDCVEFLTTNRWQSMFSTQIQLAAGHHVLSCLYQNVPNCTPGWVRCALVHPNGTPIIWTDTTTFPWRSKSGIISVEPPPDPIDVDADYNRTTGHAVIPACTDKIQVCIPVCGTDLMGPNVTLNLILSNIQGTDRVARNVAVGTIINDNHYVCDQNTNVAVLDAGVDNLVTYGARRMYINGSLPGNGSSAYVMDRKITFPRTDLYSFIFFGVDVAEVYLDCNLITRVDTLANGVKASRVRAAVNSGEHTMFINYFIAPSNARRNGYAALAILNSSNQLIYASNAADWRGRIVNAGVPPSCNQFPNSCHIQAQAGAATQGTTIPSVGYGALALYSPLHAPNCAPANTFFSFEKTINFPVSGNYTFRGFADDTLDIFIDCKSVFSNQSLSFKQTTAYVEAGNRLVTFSYKNVPNCTPGYAAFAILKPDTSLLYASEPSGWISAQGSLNNIPLPMYESYRSDQRRNVLHISPSQSSGGPNYAWWSAELDFVVPASGNYWLNANADDQVQIFIDCAARPVGGTRFPLQAGNTKIHIRLYNLKSKNPNWFWFDLYNDANQIIYSTTAAGWKAKKADLDFSGLS